MKFTNKPVYDNGEHQPVPAELIRLIHGPDCKVELPDFKTSVVIHVCDDDRLTQHEALQRVSDPTDEEAESLAERIELPPEWHPAFVAHFGEEPTEDDRRASLRETARKLLKEERRVLTDLPEETVTAIREKRMDVYEIPPERHADKRRWPMCTVQLNYLLPMLTHGKVRSDMWSDGPRRFVMLTHLRDSGFKWIAVVYMPRRERKGFVIAFPFEILLRTLETKHDVIARDYANFLDRHPSPRYRPDRQRNDRRRSGRDEPDENDDD
ncbi:hypothetical protein HY479_03005 [Candidatus Uhrbacteria bacterium]|nr:hypothetical protein [Candidatus Uhrbacteria bacterium]